MLRPTRLRTKLLLLAAGSLLPVLVLAWVLSMFLVEHERESYRTAAQARNRMFVTALETKMEGHLSSLRALASSGALQRGDLATFDVEARRVLSTQPGWQNIHLIQTDGHQVVNLRFPFNTSPVRPTPAEFERIRHVLATGETAIGDISAGPGSGLAGIPVRMRVEPGGTEAMVLQFILDPEALAPLMRTQGYPDSWAYGLADRKGEFIARHPARPAGTRMSADFERNLRLAPEGWFRGRTLEGRDTFTAFRRSEMTGWSAGVAIPADEVYGAARRAATLLLVGAALSVLVAVGFAWWLGRRIAVPIGGLAQAARLLGHGPAREELAQAKAATQLVEVHEVATALEEADAAMRERELLRQREQEALRAADKAKDEFLAMLGHELRNPLGAITASAHVLRLSRPDATAAIKAHEVIDRQARQMTRLVEDLLDVSRLAMGKVRLQTEPLDLGALTDRVVQMWLGAGRIRPDGVRVATSPAWVVGDRTRLEQVLSNLLDNAWKFSGGQATVQVRVRAEDGVAVLEVQDDGEGIVPEELPRIFELFVQGAQAFHRPQGGIGLGLTLVRRLVEMQGGTVTAYSAGKGQGACFTVRLPLAPAEGVPAPAGPAVPAQALAGRRVLLVEDNDDGRLMMESMLSLEGHLVRSVARGLDAVAVAAEWRPDVVLADIGLPDIDGYEVARRIRAMPWDEPPRLVAISGYGQPQDQRTAYEAGFDLHLVKPVAPEFLRDVMQALSVER